MAHTHTLKFFADIKVIVPNAILLVLCRPPNWIPVRNDAFNNRIIFLRVAYAWVLVCSVSKPNTKRVWVKRKVLLFPLNGTPPWNLNDIPMPSVSGFATVFKRSLFQAFCLTDVNSLAQIVHGSIINHPLMVFVALYLLTVRKLHKHIKVALWQDMDNFLELAVHAYHFVSHNKVTVIFPPVPC